MKIRTTHLSTARKPLIAAIIDPTEVTEATKADREEFWASVPAPATALEAKHRSTVGERPLVVTVDPPVEMLAAAEHPDRRPGISVPAMARDFFPTHVPLNRG